MHARQLAQIATTISTVAHNLTNPQVRVVGEAAHGYWLANRFRFDAWHQRISHHRSAIERCGTSRRARLWMEVVPTLQEILISEPLTRVIAYLSGLLEERQADADWSPLAHSVLASHVEARHRCLNLMVFGYGFPVERAVNLNRLRRNVEFFSDQLISALPARTALASYVHDVPLAKHQQLQFLRYALSSGLDRLRLQSLLVALEQSLEVDHRSPAAHPRLNQTIAESALGFLPTGVFDSLGVAHSRSMGAHNRQTGDTDITTDDLEHPLASPFDLFQPPKRLPPSKTRRR